MPKNALTSNHAQRELELLQADLTRQIRVFTTALPKHIPAERFNRVIMTACMNNPDLLDVPAPELLRECMKAANDGLLPDGKEGALVPRKKGNAMACTWQPMIAGIRKRARNSGQISVWDAHCVYENDKFKARFGSDPDIEHEPDFTGGDRGQLIAVYSICVLKDGTKSFEVMGIKEVEEIRNRSDAYKAFKAGYIKSTPWETDFSEMARKTVAKRHAKMLPTSADLDDLIRRDDDLYSFDGEATQVGDITAGGAQPKSLSARMDALTDKSDQEEHDPETGEITESEKDDEGEREDRDRRDDDRRRDRDDDRRDDRGRREDEESRAPSKGDAFRAGEAHRRAGKARRDMPKQFREDDELRSAFLDGFEADEDEGDRR